MNFNKGNQQLQSDGMIICFGSVKSTRDSLTGDIGYLYHHAGESGKLKGQLA